MAAVPDPFAVQAGDDEIDGDAAIPEVTGQTVVLTAADYKDDDEDGYEPDEPVRLGDIAADALAAGGEEQQMAIIPACRVKFVGMAWDSLDDVPSLKQEMEFVVKGRVVGHGQQVMKDGEIRETATVEVTSVVQRG